MKRGKIVALMVLVTALLLSLASISNAEAEVLVWEYKDRYDNEIEVKVYATVQAYPGDTIDVTVKAEAQEDLNDVDMDIWIEGTTDDGNETWASDKESVISGDLDDGEDVDEDFEFEVPETADPGMMVGHISCEWEVEEVFTVDTTEVSEWVAHSFDVAFPMTYLLNKDYEDLQEDYAELQTDYTKVISERDKLKTDYNSLKSDYDSLNVTFDSLKSKYDTLESDYKTLLGEKDALQKKYNSLDSEHKALQAEYDALGSEYEATVGELSNYKTYMYALAVTTVIFVITTIIFAVRKPKTV